mgnify:CR=1 FL=1
MGKTAIYWHEDGTVSKSNPLCRRMPISYVPAILGYPSYYTEFEVWCKLSEICPKKPQTSSMKAGINSEPKIRKYIQSKYQPLQMVYPGYGYDYYGDNTFTGYWDALFIDPDAFMSSIPIITKQYDQENNTIINYAAFKMSDCALKSVVEIKTTKAKNREKVSTSGPAKDHLVQACIYAYLLNIEDVIISYTFLTEEEISKEIVDKVNEENTIIFEFKISDYFDDFDKEVIVPARKWYKEHLTISPKFDEEADGWILDYLRTNKRFIAK